MVCGNTYQYEVDVAALPLLSRNYIVISESICQIIFS